LHPHLCKSEQEEGGVREYVGGEEKEKVMAEK
jgi:hypothetical protein